MTFINDKRLRLRPAAEQDIPELIRIRSTPEIRSRWMGNNIEREVRSAIRATEYEYLAIELHSETILGAIQWEEETDPDYRHANIDIFVDPQYHRQGYASEAIHALISHLFDEQAHHRLTIDPAADNEPAIRCYEKVGFRRVGVMRQYERGLNGAWHDGLLMELLADDYSPPK